MTPERPTLSIRVVSGLELSDAREIAHGSWRIVRFTRGLAEEYASRDPGDDAWRSQVQAYLRERYVGQTCLIVEGSGDREQARTKAAQVARYVLDSLRYFASIDTSDSGLAHEIDLRIAEPRPVYWIDGFEQTLQEHDSSILASGGERRRTYRLSEADVLRHRSAWRADGVWSLIEQERRTDLERAIVSALTWFGDAQAEACIEVAYLKYWMALESLVPTDRGRQMSKRWRNGVRALLRQTARRDVSREEIQREYSLQHATAQGSGCHSATWQDRNRVSRWACRAIALCVELRENGFTQRGEIEGRAAEIERIRSSDLADEGDPSC